MRASITAFIKNASQKIKASARTVATKFVALVSRLPHDYVDPNRPKTRKSRGTLALKVISSGFYYDVCSSSLINGSRSTYHLYANVPIENWVIPAEGDLNGMVGALVKIAKLDTYGIESMVISSHSVRLSISSAVPKENMIELTRLLSRITGLAFAGVIHRHGNDPHESRLEDLDENMVRHLGLAALVAAAREEEPYSSSVAHHYGESLWPSTDLPRRMFRKG